MGGSGDAGGIGTATLAQTDAGGVADPLNVDLPPTKGDAGQQSALRQSALHKPRPAASGCRCSGDGHGHWCRHPVAQGFGQVFAADIVAAGQVGDGAGHAQDPVQAACGQLQAFAGLFEQLLAGLVEAASGGQCARIQMGVESAGTRVPSQSEKPSLSPSFR